MTQKTISICIPTFNGERYIKETIFNIQRSKCSGIEIIVCDDCSQDNTVKHIREIIDSRIYLKINKKNLGVPANWNLTLKNSNGKFICFLNQDDLISPFWLEFTLQLFQKYKSVAWVLSAFRIINNHGNTLDLIRRFSENRVYHPDEIFPIAIRQDGFGPGFIVRRDALESIGGFDETIGPSADNELFIRLSARYPMFYSTYPHTAWRFHEGNLTHRWSQQEQALQGLRILEKTFNEINLPEELTGFKHQAYQYYLKKVILNVYNMIAAGKMEEAISIIQLLAFKADLFR